MEDPPGDQPAGLDKRPGGGVSTLGGLLRATRAAQPLAGLSLTLRGEILDLLALGLTASYLPVVISQAGRRQNELRWLGDCYHSLAR